MSEGQPQTGVSSKPAPERAEWDLWAWAARGLLMVAIGIAAYLLFSALESGPIAGCGASGGCNEVMQSHWSRWWKIPVTGPAMVVYIALLLLSLLRASAWRDAAVVALCVMIFGAAIWFIGLQYWRIGHYCYLCLTAHGCGVWAAMTLRPAMRGRVGWRGIGGGVLGLAVLCGGQMVLPTQMALWERGGGMAAVVLPAGDGKGRRVSMYKGYLELELNEVPVMGPPDAPHVVVVLFDVSCAHCRALHAELELARLRYGTELAIVALPMPLDARCNPGVTKAATGSANACELARLELAVWRADRTRYEEYVRYLFETPMLPGDEGVAMAKRRAELLVGDSQLAAALKDKWVEEQLKTDVEMYRANSKVSGNSVMPQMVMGEVFMQGAPNAAELEKRLAEFVGR